uniref:(California timema) hypothetical protein n=1 Tax=Timema californicum TaxID=61474 RepID=A0A7R9J7H9_TIMCA|nr:unnamed protein product [Timema californicum]
MASGVEQIPADLVVCSMTQNASIKGLGVEQTPADLLIQMYCRMFYCALLACCAHAWDLNNVTTRGATVRGVAVWRTRAFLCLSRETGAGGATLVEAPWPEPTDTAVSLKRHLEPPGSVGTSAYPNLDSQSKSLDLFQCSHHIKRILRVITTQRNDAYQVPTKLVEDAYKISKEVGLYLTVSDLWLQLFSVRPFRREGNCSCIQSVAALDVDPIGRLWVLDEGGRCPPKLVTRCELPSIEGREMRSLAVDTLSGWGARAYIGDPGGNRLMIFSILDDFLGSYVTDCPAPLVSREFHNPIDETNTAVPTEFIETDNSTVQCFNEADNIEQTKMGPSTLNGIPADENPPEIVSTEVSSFDLALSRKDPTLYLTSRKSELLFSVDLTHLRANLAPNVGQEAVLDVQYLGRKLGLSVGLTTDYKGGLHYFLPRDNVAVRWDTQIPLAAESHTITLQSAELLPSVSQLFVDQQRQVWAVTNNNGSKQHSVLLQTHRQRTHFYQ